MGLSVLQSKVNYSQLCQHQIILVCYNRTNDEGFFLIRNTRITYQFLHPKVNYNQSDAELCKYQMILICYIQEMTAVLLADCHKIIFRREEKDINSNFLGID
jgi:hypothetical protein